MKRIPNALLNKMTITDENYKEKKPFKISRISPNGTQQAEKNELKTIC